MPPPSTKNLKMKLPLFFILSSNKLPHFTAAPSLLTKTVLSTHPLHISSHLTPLPIQIHNSELHSLQGTNVFSDLEVHAAVVNNFVLFYQGELRLPFTARNWFWTKAEKDGDGNFIMNKVPINTYFSSVKVDTNFSSITKQENNETSDPCLAGYYNSIRL